MALVAAGRRGKRRTILRATSHVLLQAALAGGGHGVGGPCIERMVTTLIETASLAALDLTCVPRADAGG